MLTPSAARMSELQARSPPATPEAFLTQWELFQTVAVSEWGWAVPRARAWLSVEVVPVPLLGVRGARVGSGPPLFKTSKPLP